MQLTLSFIVYSTQYSSTHPSSSLQSNATHRLAIVRDNRPSIISLHQKRPSRTVHQQQPAMLLYLRKFLLSSFRKGAAPPLKNDEPRDPLDCYASAFCIKY
ncbi:hypothetical protein K503DRAFT_866594 [Rhizopogon vinicolor AM-OR11-026]|uniref:Uncharacterized protein n=1 Tax=Rhizopogon vinicolor AM-OR11-026 TaxID=1314800 RepID=A0A1B7MZ18_9AGAM|nr:hypothetical protein K503DRAFT_866594 [Rhizopogon vinicolor AM-OR11-026]